MCLSTTRTSQGFQVWAEAERSCRPQPVLRVCFFKTHSWSPKIQMSKREQSSQGVQLLCQLQPASPVVHTPPPLTHSGSQGQEELGKGWGCKRELEPSPAAPVNVREKKEQKRTSPRISKGYKEQQGCSKAAVRLDT